MTHPMERHSDSADAQSHNHVFLGEAHEKNERKTWAVIILSGVMMLVEIVGGTVFGSLALVADGLHMSTHAGAMMIAALAYTYARRHATDHRFVFGTGKLGDLAGFTSAVVLAMISVLIGYEAITRFRDPVSIEFREAIPIAIVGLVVNLLSAWLLRGSEHGHSHGGHDHAHEPHHDHNHDHQPSGPGSDHGVHAPAAKATTRDNSIRSAYAHVLADAFVSVLAITGLILAKVYGWLWMDPLAGIIGALVIANWSVTLIRDTAGVLLDVCPDEVTREKLRRTIEVDGDRVVDLHLWRLGPGHLAAVLAIATSKPRDALFYRARLESFECLSHITVEVTRAAAS
jgi:cation diffusion facilitator family transporter